MPPDQSSLSTQRVCAANDSAARQALAGIQSGSLTDAVTPTEISAVVGVGHSMGGMLVISQQALFETFNMIASLGYMTVPVKDDNLAAATQAIASGGSGSSNNPSDITHAPPLMRLPRSALRPTFYLDDVPAEVIAADEAAPSLVPRDIGFETILMPHVVRERAERIRVPVFIGLGDHDVYAAPHNHTMGFPNSPDVTLFILHGSSHCHNFATSRTLLWDRLGGWASSVAVRAGGTT